MARKSQATKTPRKGDGRRAATKKTSSLAAPPDSVEEFMASLEHPLKDAIEAVRRAILGVDLSIQEGIKWNSPSFKTHEWFATVNLRGKNGDDRVWLILHAGAKAGPNLKARLANSDPEALLTWLGKDRAMVVFESKADVRGKKPALAAIVRAWIGLI